MELEYVEDADSPKNGAKRQFFPFDLTYDCPDCNENHTQSFHKPGGYLSYPEWGEELEVELFCPNENAFEPTTTVNVIPTVSLELTDDK